VAGGVVAAAGADSAGMEPAGGVVAGAVGIESVGGVAAVLGASGGGGVVVVVWARPALLSVKAATTANIFISQLHIHAR